MAEIKIAFDLTFSRRFLTIAGAAAMMLCAVPELESESVTLSTYYPAPSGVYTNMITTGNTYLARDGGAATAVGIGTMSPAYKLDVNGAVRATGSVYAGNSDLYFTQAAHLATGIGNAPGHAAIENASDYNTLMILGRSGGIGGGRSVSVWDRLDVNGGLNVTANLEVAGPIQTRQGAGGPCTDVTYQYPTVGGGSINLCAGQYITMIDGLYSKKSVIPVTPNSSNAPEINARCCPCPPSGCAGM